MNKLATNRFAKFCAVGAWGFVVDAGMLLALIAIGVSAVPARAISVIVAITATWIANRVWTFASSDKNLAMEWLRYMTTSAGGAAVNFSIYCTILLLVPQTPPVLALAIASAFALMVNYLGARFFAFNTSYMR